jgi:hypothetical protein
MPDYRVTYKDSRAQAVTADTYGIHGGWYVFSRDKKVVLSITADVIESIATAGVPEATLPEVEVGVA